MSKAILYSVTRVLPLDRLMHASAYFVGSCSAKVVSALAKDGTRSCSSSFLSRKQSYAMIPLSHHYVDALQIVWNVLVVLGQDEVISNAVEARDKQTLIDIDDAAHDLRMM